MTKPDGAVWSDVLSYLRTRHADKCRQWFDEIEPVGVSAGVFYARVPNSVRQRYLERDCTDLFTEALQAVTGTLLSARFLGPDEPDLPAPALAGAPSEHNGAAPPRPRAPAVHPPRALPRTDGLAISPDYTFENFIVGPESRYAHAAAVAVVKNPGRTYNPLFIHGGVGLGKTHLLQAVCLGLLGDTPDLSIFYVSCEEFMTRFMDAVQAGEMHDFRHLFRDVDVLVIDDIHFLTKRERTQEEFFHTFNTLYQNQKQIILSSDAAPQDIPDLEHRLVSRFQCGLVVEILPPCFETRVQIVKQKARIRGVDLKEDVACFVAQRMQTNVRELEGAVVRLQMQSIADERPIDMALARLALDPGGTSISPRVTITSIIDAVVSYYGVKLTDLQSKRRQKSIAHPRQVCMFLARKHTDFSLEEIGGYFGGRDHTTVMHAVKTVDIKRDSDEHFQQILASLEEQIRVSRPPERPLQTIGGAQAVAV